jgi:glycyl-tRNA synthetase beta chain
MATLLLELFSEEIPSRMQRAAMEQLSRLIVGGFEKAGLPASDVKTFVSPRHLAIQLFGLPDLQPDVHEEKKGPKIGAPEQALKGFLNSVGLSVDQCEKRDNYYFAVIHRKGRKTAEIAKEVIETALTQFTWPKSMHWGSRQTRPAAWVRPLHRIVALLDKEIVPAQFAHLTASNVTQGHRFLSKGEITIAHAEEYVEKLKAANVLVDYATRRDWIEQEVGNLAKLHNLTVVRDEALVDEVTGLVEWPVPLLGSFDAKFLELPQEVAVMEMKVHQRYFALQDKNGKLSNQFIAVANMVTKDEGKKVIAGNERVLRARLSDGEFYWQQDQKTPLDAWGKKLSDVVFHAKVGMLSEKVSRIEKLALTIAKEVGFTDTKSVSRAAQLAKADLTSGMVGEFPDLQGIMGRYYATAQGESQEVADAIRDHYKPLGASDSLPASDLAAIIALADKLDSIISLFAAGEKPTGSKDPFALRRAALGVLRILRDKNWHVDLDVLIKKAGLQSLTSILPTVRNIVAQESLAMAAKDLSSAESKVRLKIAAQEPKDGKDVIIHFGNKAATEVTDFFRDRLKTMLRDEGIRHDVLDAVFAKSAGAFNPLQIAADTKALLAFTANQAETLAAIKRALNILAAEEKKSKTTYQFAAAKTAAFAKPAEQELLKALQSNVVSLDALATLAAPINQFFEQVMVTEEGFRDARLSLLAGVRERAMNNADFTKIEG